MKIDISWTHNNSIMYININNIHLSEADLQDFVNKFILYQPSPNKLYYIVWDFSKILSNTSIQDIAKICFTIRIFKERLSNYSNNIICNIIYNCSDDNTTTAIKEVISLLQINSTIWIHSQEHLDNKINSFLNTKNSFLEDYNVSKKNNNIITV